MLGGYCALFCDHAQKMCVIAFCIAMITDRSPGYGSPAVAFSTSSLLVSLNSLTSLKIYGRYLPYKSITYVISGERFWG